MTDATVQDNETLTIEPSRFPAAFAASKAEGRTAILPFATVGYPDLATSEAVLVALAEQGADGFEIGIPFSDPLADGTTVQRSSFGSLANGTTVRDCLDLVGRLREVHHLTQPIALMGYYNPILQFGPERIVAEAARVGADGLIVPDLPVEESDLLWKACRKHGRDLIFMVAPTSTDERLRAVAERASGFIYCVSLVGVTGERSQLAEGLESYLERVRRFTDVPLAVGFGISTAEHVRTVGQHADGAIVASALINHLDNFPRDEQPAAAKAWLAALQASAESTAQ